MNHSPPNLNALWGSLIVEELIRNGLEQFCISPGSRSTPLTAAVARNKKAKQRIFYDERGAAFYALGLARAAGKPAVLICTSGTAAANYYPAVIEASVDCLPLIVITADRPPELRETGANQTIPQPNLFGKFSRWQFDLPCPDINISPETVLTTVDQLIYRSQRSPAGPVHLNCMFREPFFSGETEALDPFSTLKGDQSINHWQQSNTPFTTYHASHSHPSPAELENLKPLLGDSSDCLIIAGKMNPNEAEAVRRLAAHMNCPVFPDITSGLRMETGNGRIIHYFDQLLLSENLQNELSPKVILHFGGQLTSKRWLQFVDRKKPENYILVQNHPFRYDPMHIVTQRFESDIPAFCQQLSAVLPKQKAASFVEALSKKNTLAEAVISQFVRHDDKINEIAAAHIVSKVIPSETGLFLAASMPVRDMDMYAAYSGNPLRISANRGASGIDGTIASAAGFAAGLAAPVTLMIGDLAFLHDLNSLAIAADQPQPLIIVLINNQGGGIFSFLPVSQQKDIFEPFFGTPHALKFSHAANLFGLTYAAPESCTGFKDAYLAAVSRKTSTIIEIKTDRKENKTLHNMLQQQIIQAIESEGN